MKTTALRTWTAVCLSVLTAAAVISASADQQTTATKHNKSYTGTVNSVDPKEHVLGVKGAMLGKTFNLGDSCDYMFLKGAGSISDLRSGQKVTVSYQNAQGVLVANRIEQRPLRYEGTVKAIDPETRMLILHRGAMDDKKLQIADDCAFTLHGNKSGTLAALKPGQRVSVIYETPNGTRVARQIDQTSTTFTGTLTAIDLNTRTLKVKHVFGTKKFNLADGCKISLNGKTDAQLRDLKLGDDFTLMYDTVNGVNVVNRIAQAEAPLEIPTADIGPY